MFKYIIFLQVFLAGILIYASDDNEYARFEKAVLNGDSNLIRAEIIDLMKGYPEEPNQEKLVSYSEILLTMKRYYASLLLYEMARDAFMADVMDDPAYKNQNITLYGRINKIENNLFAGLNETEFRQMMERQALKTDLKDFIRSFPGSVIGSKKNVKEMLTDIKDYYENTGNSESPMEHVYPWPRIMIIPETTIMNDLKEFPGLNDSAGNNNSITNKPEFRDTVSNNNGEANGEGLSWQPDVMPEFDILLLNRNIVIPDSLRNSGLRGKVIVEVLINTKGEPENIIVVSSDNEILNEPVINAVKKTKFTPAMSMGKPVSCRITFPISFNL